jgi:hypothetical protein
MPLACHDFPWRRKTSRPWVRDARHWGSTYLQKRSVNYSILKTREDIEMKPILGRHGEVIAYENKVNERRLETRDRSNGLIAAYNPESGKTTDRAGKTLSNSGDIRASFLPNTTKTR